MTVPPDASSLNGRTLFLRPADGKRVKFILHRYFPHPSFPHHAAARHAVHACTDGNTRRQTVQNHLCGLMERTGIPFAVPIQLQGIGAAAVKEPMHGAFSVPVCISVPCIFIQMGGYLPFRRPPYIQRQRRPKQFSHVLLHRPMGNYRPSADIHGQERKGALHPYILSCVLHQAVRVVGIPDALRNVEKPPAFLRLMNGNDVQMVSEEILRPPPVGVLVGKTLQGQGAQHGHARLRVPVELQIGRAHV